MSTIEIPNGKVMNFVFRRIWIVCSKSRHRGHPERENREFGGGGGAAELE